jgi:hypothetical protein
MGCRGTTKTCHFIFDDKAQIDKILAGFQVKQQEHLKITKWTSYLHCQTKNIFVSIENFSILSIAVNLKRI